MNIRILIVEDEDVIGDLLEGAIKNRLAAHAPSVRRCKSIPASGEELQEFRPHIVTLDLKDETTDDIAAGKPAWDYISNRHFCPVVFFSANDLPPGFPDGRDPFAPFLSKHDKNADDVAVTVETFLPYVIGLEKIRAEVEGRYAQSLQKVSSVIWKAETEENARVEALIRITRRRLAATLEHPLAEEANIKAWEQFIYPPTDKDHLCTGDVVFQRGADRTKADNFRIILTPPCDLVPGQNAIAEVLLGKCISVAAAEVFRRAGIQVNPTPTTKLAEKLAKDEVAGLKLIPKLGDLWPTMVLDFKALELVPRTTIALSSETANAESKFERIASMDSPFREALSWRFMQTAGRPGTPEADRTTLETEIKAAI